MPEKFQPKPDQSPTDQLIALAKKLQRQQTRRGKVLARLAELDGEIRTTRRFMNQLNNELTLALTIPPPEDSRLEPSPAWRTKEQPPMTLDWQANPDGEYNEHRRMMAGGEVVLYSDRDGAQWAYTLDAGEPIRLDAKTLHEAQREVERDLRS